MHIEKKQKINDVCDLFHCKGEIIVGMRQMAMSGDRYMEVCYAILNVCLS